jgi:uncharacterized surface protein with fasciclin (FAS1) repeats
MKRMLSVCAVALFAAVAPTQAADDIVTIAAGNKDFSTLVTAVKAAGLVDALKAEGPITVFAPTNAAFEKLGKDKVAAVLADKALLTKILKAHVVEGKVLAADAVKLDGKQVNGFTVKVAGGGVKIGDAKVVKTDIIASNGVIHVIDTVLVPDAK